MNPNDSLVGMAEVTENKLMYSEKSWANPRTEIDIRVNIRPRKLYFLGLLNFGQSYMGKGKKGVMV